MFGLVFAVAAAVAPGTLAVDPSASTLKYTVVHKLHKVDATSHEVEGKAVVRPDGTVLTEVRAQVATFRSGDGNRDEHMAETMELGKFPNVVLKAVGKLGPGGAVPEPLVMNAQVELHGVKQAYPIQVSVQPQPDGSLHVTSAFDVGLDSHQIDRPSLLFVKIEDACHVDVDLVLREEKK
ncbi:MAG: YceI family protein [Myxococcales bacterium]